MTQQEKWEKNMNSQFTKEEISELNKGKYSFVSVIKEMQVK